MVARDILGFNAGQVDRRALVRSDISKMRFAAEVQENLLPSKLGYMTFRPGTERIISSYQDKRAKLIPFLYNVNTKALLEMTSLSMRIIVNDAILTRPSVASSITNPWFDTDINDWVNQNELGGQSSWVAGAMKLQGTGVNYAARSQLVTTSDPGTEHALRLNVGRGDLTLRIGTTVGDDNILAETTLTSGLHSIAFTPSGSYYVWVGSNKQYPCYLNSVVVESAGEVVITTPWDFDALSRLKYDQSADVIFVCDGEVRPKRIERRSQRSWSLVDYFPKDGPFEIPERAGVSLTSDSKTQQATITSSTPLFKSSWVGALLRLTHVGQSAEALLAGDDQFTSEIRISGTDAGGGSFNPRDFGVYLDFNPGWSGTVTLQRSIGEPGAWEDYDTFTGPSDLDFVENDNLDNQIIYYRLGIKAGDYTSGSVVARLSNDFGSQTGVCVITARNSSTSIDVDIITPFGSTNATSTWDLGVWGDHSGYPSCVAFHDGRLFWGYKDKVIGSVSDAFQSFDDTVDGDSAPIQRTIATGGVDKTEWLLSLQRLVAGTSAQEVSIRASAFDEPLTQTQFSAKAATNRGSSKVQAVAVDSDGIFVQRDRKTVFGLVFTGGDQDYNSGDLTELVPDICSGQIRAMAVQRSPDTRIWCVMEDGTAAVLLYERAEDVVGWVPIVTSPGEFEDVVVLPGDGEDEVYFMVRRGTRHLLEKMAPMSSAQGGNVCRNLDSHLMVTGNGSATITGLFWLEGLIVRVWADGKPIQQDFTVSGGQITLPYSVDDACVGITYTGKYLSARNDTPSQLGSSVTRPKRVFRLGLVLYDVSPEGIRIGADFDKLRDMPMIYKGKPLTEGQVLSEYEFYPVSMRNGFTSDSRVCIEIKSPNCATFSCLVPIVEDNPREEGVNRG